VEPDRREELEEYLAKIVGEVSRRSEVVKKTEQELRSQELLLEGSAAKRLVLAGDASRRVAEEAYRRTLRKRIQSLNGKMIEAKEDLERARERLNGVELELAEFKNEDETNNS